jgi:hypothetical protein
MQLLNVKIRQSIKTTNNVLSSYISMEAADILLCGFHAGYVSLMLAATSIDVALCALKLQQQALGHPCVTIT